MLRHCYKSFFPYHFESNPGRFSSKSWWKCFVSVLGKWTETLDFTDFLQCNLIITSSPNPNYSNGLYTSIYYILSSCKKDQSAYNRLTFHFHCNNVQQFDSSIISQKITQFFYMLLHTLDYSLLFFHLLFELLHHTMYLLNEQLVLRFLLLHMHSCQIAIFSVQPRYLLLFLCSSSISYFISFFN